MSENVENLDNEEIASNEEKNKETACSSFLRVVILFGLISGLVVMLLYLD